MDTKVPAGGRSLFVRGVSYDVTDDQFSSHFSDVGPVNRAFLVKAGKEGQHKGYGFVQFALAEDAQKAAAQLNGSSLGGRKLKVEVAAQRASFDERKKRKQERGAGQEGSTPPVAPPPRATKRARPSPGAELSAADKHALVRSVAVGGSGLSKAASVVDTKALTALLPPALRDQLERCLALPGAYVSAYNLGRDGLPSGPAALLQFKTVKAALEGVAALHGSGSDVGGVWARQVSGDGLYLKRWRVVVRNLPFTVTEAALRAAFGAAGFVWELTLPRSASGRARGFAFVGFLCHSDAERAIRDINGIAVAGRPVAVDWALSKAQYRAEGEAGIKNEEPKPELQDATPMTMDKDEDGSSEDDERDEKLAVMEDVGAEGVDPEAEADMQTAVLKSLLGGDDEASDGEEADGEDAGDEEAPVVVKPPRDNMDDIFGKAALAVAKKSASAGDVSKKPATSGKNASKPAAATEAATSGSPAAVTAAAGVGQDEAGPEEVLARTVFVRGLPLDVIKEQVWDKLKVFGRLRACRLVMDKATDKPKGTAFVEYVTSAGAEAAAAAAAAARESRGAGIAIGGRQVEVDLALAADAARAAAAKSQEDWRAKDKRNLYLAKEGAIPEGCPAWEALPAGDQVKRRRAAVERKSKLASPNFVVSRTRLSVRNLPGSWDEKRLKTAFLEAVRARASQANPVVRQAKILREEDRLDDAGRPKSKGIAFVEFTEHEHALCALRQLNNNPQIFHKDRRPIIEFAIDNVKALKAHEARAAFRKPAPAEGKDASQDAPQQPSREGDHRHLADQAAGEEPAQEKSKRQLRKERNRVAKERREAAQNAGVDGKGAGAGDSTKPTAATLRSQRRRLQRQRKAGKVPAEGGVSAPGAAKAVVPAAKVSAAHRATAPTSNGVVTAGKGQTTRKQGRTDKRGEHRGATNERGDRGIPDKRDAASTRTPSLKAKAAPTKRSAAATGRAAPSTARDGEAPAQSRRAGKNRAEDKLELLVNQYKEKLLGSSSPAGTGKKGKASKEQQPSKLSLRRWFE